MRRSATLLDLAEEAKARVAGPAPVPEAAAQAAPTMEQLKVQIYMKPTPDDLLTMVHQVAEGKRVKADPALHAEFLKQCSAYVEHQIGKGNWTEESAIDLDCLLSSTYRTLVEANTTQTT